MSKYLVSLALLLAPALVQAQNDVWLIDIAGQRPRLTELDRQYIIARMDQLDFASCQTRLLRQRPRIVYRQLTLPHDGQDLHVNVAADVMRTGNMVIYTQRGDEWQEYYDCPQDIVLPTLAIIATARVDYTEEVGSNAIKQEVLARHTQLSSHEPSKLMMRTDSDDINALYLDFTLSSKHPLLPNATPLVRTQELAADLLEDLIPGDDEYLLQLYLAFSGRFSQYVRTRDSSPVVARRFNPSLFYRIWSSDDSWLDIGFAHESNGQRISTPESYARERADFVARREDADFARDSLSRGWDYSFIEWRHDWSSKLVSELKLSHYLRSGPLQGQSEEYYLWEDNGARLRPRRQYDGVSLGLQYNFNRSRCFLGDAFVCLRELELTQETGYSAMFDHNTTTLEFTSDVFGLPVQLWGRTGYNSDLVDYYRYVNSWGIGFELRTP